MYRLQRTIDKDDLSTGEWIGHRTDDAVPLLQRFEGVLSIELSIVPVKRLLFARFAYRDLPSPSPEI
jgi:hypothetical protein